MGWTNALEKAIEDAYYTQHCHQQNGDAKDKFPTRVCAFYDIGKESKLFRGIAHHYTVYFFVPSRWH